MSKLQSAAGCLAVISCLLFAPLSAIAASRVSLCFSLDGQHGTQTVILKSECGRYGI
jgi:hypothetical protein